MSANNVNEFNKVNDFDYLNLFTKSVGMIIESYLSRNGNKTNANITDMFKPSFNHNGDKFDISFPALGPNFEKYIMEDFPGDQFECIRDSSHNIIEKELCDAGLFI